VESTGAAVSLAAPVRQPQANDDGDEQAHAQAEGYQAAGEMHPDGDEPEDCQYDDCQPK